MKKIIITTLLSLSHWLFSLQLTAQLSPVPIIKNASSVLLSECPGNIIADGGFEQLSVIPGTSDISTGSSPWQINTSSPQQATAGCTNSGMLAMWGNQTTGESVFQTGLSIQQNKKYRISVTARFINPSANVNFVRLKIFAFNGNGPTSYNSNTNVIGITPDISSSNCITINLPDWTAPANFNSIQLHPENDFQQNDGNYVSWIQIDNICMTEVPSCTCGKWEGFEYSLSERQGTQNSNIKPLLLTCGKTIVVKIGSILTLNPRFNCTGPDCKAQYKAVMITPDNKNKMIGSFPYLFYQTKPGLYTVTVTPVCNGKQCSACTIKIYVTPGCNGDIVSTRFFDVDYLTAYEQAINPNINTGAFLNLDVNAAENTYMNLPNGSYSINSDKEGIWLLNRNTGQLLEKYKFHKGIPGTGLSCNDEETEQWEAFNRDVAPGLQNRANQFCANVTYCLGITCSGNLKTFYLLVFKPNSRNCRYAYENIQILKTLAFTRLVSE